MKTIHIDKGHLPPSSIWVAIAGTEHKKKQDPNFATCMYLYLILQRLQEESVQDVGPILSYAPQFALSTLYQR